MRSLSCALLLAALLPAFARAGAVCPLNSIDRGAFFDQSTAPVHSWSADNGYDLRAGTLRAASGGGGEVGAFTQLFVRDRYRIVGPASAAPIPVRVLLHATGVAPGDSVTLPFLGRICSRTNAKLRLASGSAVAEVTVQSSTEPVCASRAIDEWLALDLAHLPGQEFEVAVSFNLSNGPLLTVRAAGALSFTNLPAGYTIESCQGYAGPVVPALAASWGRLKNAYR